MLQHNQKTAFIINPNAGIKKKINIEDFIHQHFANYNAYDIIVWENKNDFEPIKLKILNGNYTQVIACGGDGTVNNVSAAIVNTNMALGILPLGSGNGLARSNFIPMQLIEALNVIKKNKIKKIDSGVINNNPFFCTAGIGFDALIAEKFASSNARGFITYFKTTIKEYFNYKPNTYNISVDGNELNVNAFLITIANAGQWGNNVYIAPEAELTDGFLRISILTPFSNIMIPLIALKLFSKKIHTSSKLISLKGKKINILFKGLLPVHFDGEPIFIKDKVTIDVIPLSLQIIC